MQAIGTKIFVVPEAVEQVTSGGIIIPNANVSRQRTRRGKVISAGPDSGINEGEIVHFGQKSGKPIEVNGVTMLILNVDENNNEVLAVEAAN